MENYPDALLRGIRDSKLIVEDQVSTMVFYPNEKTKELRDDGYMETSINWEDDENALNFTIKLFPNGAVRLPKVELEHINRYPTSRDDLLYERSPQENNSYHGNILFRGDLPKSILRLRSASLASAASFVIKK